MKLRDHKPTRWNLNSLYGKKHNFFSELEDIETTLHNLQLFDKTNSTSFVDENHLLLLSQIIKRIEKADSFYYCLTTDSPEDLTHSTFAGRISSLKSNIYSISDAWNRQLEAMTEKQYTEWSSLPSVRPFIAELLKKNDSVPIILADFISESSIYGLKAWEDMYIQLRNKLEVNINDGKMSFGQANYIAMNDSDHSLRNQVFKSFTHTLEKNSNLFASILNNMTGFRLTMYRAKGQKDALEESLQLNGVSRSTLCAMWNAIDDKLIELTYFLQIKAKENQVEKLSWHQLMSSDDSMSSIQLPFAKAVERVVHAFNNINPQIGDFAKNAIVNGWVDAEPRDNKPPGGFCAPFISDRESRISLRYDGSLESARILAHELGHAWHFHQLDDAPTLSFLEDRFEMTIAETSSIFFELVFIDNMIRDTEDNELKKSLLNWKIQSSINYLMAVRGSYLFESQYYEKRKTGPLSADQIEEISIKAQQETYGNSLREYQPFVWMKYIQFYQSDFPFYNYPYTFGYLLSLGLLELAKQEENQFFSKFTSFLKETGTKPVEELVMEHFDIKLSQHDFWNNAIKSVISDIEEYTYLTNKKM